MQFITGGWASAILGSAARHGVFNALEGGADRAEGVASKSGISLRGAQAVLDGLTGLGLVSHVDGRYQNSPDASVFVDFILSDDRTGHPFAMLFASQMLLVTQGGFTWRQSDYRKWLGEAGFAPVDIVPTPTPSTLVFAR
jgi:hypothetical protein